MPYDNDAIIFRIIISSRMISITRLTEHVETKREVIQLHEIVIDKVNRKSPTHTVYNNIEMDFYRNMN
jgi:hypothetical protein